VTQDSSTQIYQDSAITFLQSLNQRARTRDLEKRGISFERSFWSEIATMGWLGMCVPEDQNGLGLDLNVASSIAQICAQELLPEPIWDASFLPLEILRGLQQSALRDELIAKVISGELVVGLALQEQVGDPFGLEVKTSLSVKDQCLTLNGSKKFVRPGADADGCLVWAQNAGTPAWVWLPCGNAQVHWKRQVGIDGLGLDELTLRDCELTQSHLLDQGAGLVSLMEKSIEKLILLQCAQLIGLSEKTLEISTEYLRTRIQFGKAIGSNQALQHKMVDLMMALELSKFAFMDVIHQYGDGSLSQAHLSALVSRLKSRCALTATELTRWAIHYHGAIGTTNEYDIGHYFKRAMFLSAQFGNVAFHKKRFSQLLENTYLNRSNTTEDLINLDEKLKLDFNALSDLEFRQIVRALFKAYYPEERRYLPYRQSWSESKDWYMTLSRLGWLAPAWPKEIGGMGLNPEKLIAYIEETEAYGVARCPDQGLVMVGPILMKFGTPVQLEQYLPKILSGEHIWTQGYSEPNAGSDLAGVQTSAVLEGSQFRVNGQKTWTTWGMDGTHMFMLVRTDKTVKKQAGISFLLVDLRSPGITIRPIENIAGETDFCEVFFDQVLVPAENLVGQVNEGWTIAKALLGYERLFTGSPKHSQHTIHQVAKLAKTLGLFEDPLFVSKFTDLQLDTEDLMSAYTHFASIAKRGEVLPASISILKIWSTETYERLAVLLIEAAQEYACIKEHSQDIDMHVIAPLFNAMGAKIFAGSNEIQRNILSKSVLNLPN